MLLDNPPHPLKFNSGAFFLGDSVKPSIVINLKMLLQWMIYVQKGVSLLLFSQTLLALYLKNLYIASYPGVTISSTFLWTINIQFSRFLILNLAQYAYRPPSLGQGNSDYGWRKMLTNPL